MVYTLVSAVQDKLQEYSDAVKGEQDRQQREKEEEERRKEEVSLSMFTQAWLCMCVCEYRDISVTFNVLDCLEKIIFACWGCLQFASFSDQCVCERLMFKIGLSLR